MKRLIITLLLVALLAPSVNAAKSVDDQKIIIIDDDIHDDFFVSGDQITINGNINGDLFAAGGEIVVNGNVMGDAYIVGGNVTVNGKITGGLILGAGKAAVSGKTGKILAGCGDLAVKGNTEKIIAFAGNVKIFPSSVVDGYAHIVAGEFENQGTIKGELKLSTEQLIEKGSVGSFDYTQRTARRGISQGIRSFIAIISILASIGMFVLGVLLVHLFPKLFSAVESEMGKDTIVKTIVGFLLAILAVIVTVILALTLVGLPIAVIFGMVTLIALMTSGLFVSHYMGKIVTKKLNINTSDIGIFIIGFVILVILKLVPVLGFFVNLVTGSLGFGAICYTIKNKWNLMTAKN